MVKGESRQEAQSKKESELLLECCQFRRRELGKVTRTIVPTCAVLPHADGVAIGWRFGSNDGKVGGWAALALDIC